MSEPKPEYKHGGKRPDAGRKPRVNGKAKRISLSLSEEQYDDLKDKVKGTKLTVAAYIRLLIDRDRDAAE